MNNDPIVEDVRTIRRELETEHGNNPQRLMEHYRKTQARDKDRLFTGKPQLSKGESPWRPALGAENDKG